MTAEVRLVSSQITAPTDVRILCERVTVSGKKNTVVKPNANGDNITEVQTQGFENPKYILAGVRFDPNASESILTYKNVLELLKAKYNGSSQVLLQVTYGTSNTLLSTSDLTSTSIPVVLESFTFPVDVRDSRDGYLPVATLSFVETA